MMKVMFGCGLYAAFHGSSEHTFFSRSQVKFGFYPKNFQNSSLAGTRYVSIDNIPSDKTSKLTVTNSYARDTSNIMRFPIVEGDMNNFGGSLERLVKKMAPGQSRMYCKPAPYDYNKANWDKGYPNSTFYSSIVCGSKKISQMFKDGAKILGLEHPMRFKPHSLRGACITMLANDNSVSLAETMAVARHTSVSASKVYQRVDGISECNRLRALGQLPTIQEDSGCVEGGDDDIEWVDFNRKSGDDVISVGGVDDDDIISVGTATSGDVAERICAIEDQMDGIVRPRGGGGTSNISLTQVGIDELKEELEVLKGKMARKKRPAASERQVEVAKLRKVVHDLKTRLEDQELYSGSLEHDMDTRVKELEAELKKERRLRKKAERENREFERVAFAFPDRKKRSRY